MQILHSYGAKPNEDFLQYYGFVDIDNVNDAYTADLLQWVMQHFHAEADRVQAVQKSKAASQLLKQVFFHAAHPTMSNHTCKAAYDSVRRLRSFNIACFAELE